MAIVVSDNFDRADSTTTLGTAVTGQTWVVNAGTWGIIGNQAYQVAAADGGFASIDSGLVDCNVQVTFATNVVNTRLAFRITDANNLYLIQNDGDSSYSLYRRQAGAWTLLGNSSGVSPANGDVIKVTLNGGSISCFVNGVVKITITGETFNLSATKHGLGWDTDASPRLDNFLVESTGVAGTVGAVSYATKQSINRTASAAYATKQVINRTASVAFATKQIIRAVGLSAFATKQIISQVGSVAYATQQTITNGGIPGSVAYSTKQIISLTASLLAATRQSIYQAGSSEWATKQSIIDFVEIVKTVNLLGEWLNAVSLQGECINTVSLQGEFITSIPLLGEMINTVALEGEI